MINAKAFFIAYRLATMVGVIVTEMWLILKINNYNKKLY